MKYICKIELIWFVTILLSGVILLWLVDTGLAANVKTSMISQKSTNTLGLDMDFAVMDITFDQDLYLLQSISCPNHTCHKPPVDCTCDYTDPNNCGKTVSGDPSCPECPKNTTLQYDGYEYVYDLCDTINKQWTTVQANQTYRFEDIKAPLYIRYKANNTYCEGLRIYASQEQGSFILFANSDNSETGRMIGYENPSLNNNLNICPTDNIDWGTVFVYTNNTYFITIIPTYSPSVTFSLNIFSAPISPSAVNPTTCSDISPDHKCINDGEQLLGQSRVSEEPHFYTFTVDRPMNLSIGCPALQEDIDFFISDDPSIQFPDVSTPNIKWTFNHPVDDYLTMSIAPYENGTAKILYMSIVPYYPSNFSCVVTSTSKIWAIPITNNTAIGGTFNIMGTARLVYPDGTTAHSDYWENTRAFFISFPRVSSNPLWPVPNVLGSIDLFKKIRFFNTIQFEEPSNPAKNSSFQAAFILSYRDDSLVYFNDFDTIKQSSIEFLNMIVDSSGKPLDMKIGFNVSTTSCNYDEFNELLKLIKDTENVIFSSKTYQDVSTLRYAIDIYTLRDAWVGCMGLSNDLLQFETNNISQPSTVCTYSPGDEEYQKDPCCYGAQQFFQCCVPRNVTLSTKSFVGVYNDKINEQCSSIGCTASVLDDYYKSLKDVEEGACAITYADYQEFQDNVANTLRQCKSVYQVQYCTNDTDCGGSNCNLYSRICDFDRVQQDYNYLECVLNSSSSSTIYFLKNQGKWNTIDELYNLFQSPDCVYPTGNFYRTRYTFNTIANVSHCYPPPICLDQSCLVEHDVCYDGYYGGYNWAPIQYDQDLCSNSAICPWINCISEEEGCMANCTSKPNFCGYCSNNISFCHNFKEFATEATCENKKVCLLPDGTYRTDVTTEAACSLLGKCTSDCGNKCTGYKGCVAPHLSQTACANTNTIPFGKWNTTYGYCYNNYTLSQCNTAKFDWVDCALKTTSECNYKLPNGINLCSPQPIACSNKQSCENVGGTCSDEFFFNKENLPYYNRYGGKCVHGHAIQQSENTIPTCNYETEHDSPKGCFSIYPNVYTKNDCNKLNSTWWEASTNRSSCLSHEGCRIRDNSPFSPQNQYRFNEMDKDECIGCGSVGNHEWANMFTWKNGTWLKGVLVSAHWMDTTPLQVSKWNYTLDLNAFATAMGNAYYGHIVDLLRSSAMCRMERLQETIGSIACSCSGPGGSQCFTSSAILLGTAQACALDQTVFKFSLGHLQFNPDSVAISCNSVIVSQISRQLFKATTKQSLSSDFVSYKKPDNYALYNSRGGLIGTILNDGIKVQATGVNNYGVCLLAGELTSNFQYYDFATESVNDSTILIPVNAEITAVIREPGQPIMICANFTQPYNSYFPIARVSDWSNQPKEIFDKSATGMIYTLGVIFTLCALWGMAQLAVVFYKRVNQVDKLKLVHLLIATVTLFIMIRAIYFFILPSGKLSQSAVAEYILVVLPTFIYFTSFSIIVVLWYVIVRSKISNNILTKFSTMIGVINIILYVLFIIIVLVFNFSERKYTNDCGARLVVEQTNTTPQRVVSIVYAVFQAFISLIIGTAFVYLGGSMYMMMKFRKSVTDSATSTAQQKRIFIVTHACSIGFILHCVFVLILVAANPSNIIFSFVGLIVTEIIPVLSILYSYNQGHLSGIKQNTNTTRMTYVTPSKESFNTDSSSVKDSSMKSTSRSSRMEY